MTFQGARRTVLVLLSATSLALQGCASGHLDSALPLLAPEARVRLTTRERDESGDWVERVYVGRLVAIDSVSLTVALARSGADETVVLRRATVLIAEVSQATRHYMKEGALAGLGAGLLIGGAIVQGTDSCRASSTCSSKTELKNNETIATYAVIGAAAGALIGFLVRSDVWSDVPPRGP